ASPAVDPLILLVGAQIYCPSVPENVDLKVKPAISFFTRGGTSTPYIPGIISPSVQFDCWAIKYDGELFPASQRAREVYRALYDALQGIQNITVGAYKILSAIEEVQGQDLVDVEIPNYFRTLTFFEIMIRAE
ncbi:unnamed protein product, partial [marine sediment metagenome]